MLSNITVPLVAAVDLAMMKRLYQECLAWRDSVYSMNFGIGFLRVGATILAAKIYCAGR